MQRLASPPHELCFASITTKLFNNENASLLADKEHRSVRGHEAHPAFLRALKPGCVDVHARELTMSFAQQYASLCVCDVRVHHTPSILVQYTNSTLGTSPGHHMTAQHPTARESAPRPPAAPARPCLCPHTCDDVSSSDGWRQTRSMHGSLRTPAFAWRVPWSQLPCLGNKAWTLVRACAPDNLDLRTGRDVLLQRHGRLGHAHLRSQCASRDQCADEPTSAAMAAVHRLRKQMRVCSR